MFAPLLLALLALSPESRADAGFELRAGAPVIVKVDGRPSRWTGKLRHRIDGLRPGSHDVRIESLFGTLLYEGELQFEDERTVHATWQKGRFVVLGTSALHEDFLPGKGDTRPYEVAVAPAELPEEPEVSEEPELEDWATETPEESEPEEVVAAEDLPLALPAGAAHLWQQAPVVPDEPVEAVLDEPVEAVLDEPAVPDEPAGAASVQAVAAVPDEMVAVVAVEPVAEALGAGLSEAARLRAAQVHLAEGMSLDVHYGDRQLTLYVEDGRLMLDDGQGFRIELR